MNISNANKETYDLLKRSLDASSTRGKVIANNIANINTKGYKRFYVTFEDTLNQSKEDFALKTTDKNHMNYGEEIGDIQVKQDKDSSIRQDGNNVDIDNEMSNQAANSLMYNALVTQINSKLALQRYVINGGRG